MSEFHAIYWQEGEWWAGIVEEMPSTLAIGVSLDQVQRNLAHTMGAILRNNCESAKRIAGNKAAVREKLVVD